MKKGLAQQAVAYGHVFSNCMVATCAWIRRRKQTGTPSFEHDGVIRSSWKECQQLAKNLVADSDGGAK